MRNVGRVIAGIALLISGPLAAAEVATKSRSNIQNNRSMPGAGQESGPAAEAAEGGVATRSRSNIQNNRSMPASNEASGPAGAAPASACTTDRKSGSVIYLDRAGTEALRQGAPPACEHAINSKGTGASGRAAASGGQTCGKTSAEGEVVRAASQPGPAAPTCSEGSSATPPK